MPRQYRSHTIRTTTRTTVRRYKNKTTVITTGPHHSSTVHYSNGTKYVVHHK